MIEKYIENGYYFLLYLSYLLYAILILNITYFKTLADLAPYLPFVQNILIYIIVIFLMVRFNPWTTRTQMYTEFDKNIVFSAAIFLFTTTTFGIMFMNYLKLPLDVVSKTYF